MKPSVWICRLIHSLSVITLDKMNNIIDLISWNKTVSKSSDSRQIPVKVCVAVVESTR